MKAIKTTDLKEMKKEKENEKEEMIVAYAAIADLNEQVIDLKTELEKVKGGVING